ncbi:flagellar motor stator protein MotA [Sneathiella sp. CAU 1612]|jgi:chemotaxis protein MotA|uniref:Flagellar motor stator protein MotA n=1 Tax=Sneathiella sedimenti TaxID=2816034 RepID=A0ABS3F7A3_9PROT|nr:flagellar motor stator protein MotA [Sneathiella sedimenti]MBO0334400.1 flagellar motor stator protein MotA [Sneathiella sedimenti]
MFWIIGIVVTFGSVAGGYAPHGSFAVLFQPLEFLIILGAAAGAFLQANPKWVIFGFLKSFGKLMKGAPYDKKAYTELLTLLYALFKLSKSKGMIALEPHIENPHESELFQHFPSFSKNHHAVDFVCDYLRLMTMGTENPHELEALMDQDIETHHNEGHAISGAVTALGEALPAFGIVAAVLGVIVTMGSIAEPPEVLGGLIAAALVGTFFGIFVAYGLFSPMGKNLEQFSDADGKYFECIKQGLLAHLQGYAPAVSVEFARKTLYNHERPSFIELEEACNEAPTI